MEKLFLLHPMVAFGTIVASALLLTFLTYVVLNQTNKKYKSKPLPPFDETYTLLSTNVKDKVQVGDQLVFRKNGKKELPPFILRVVAIEGEYATVAISHDELEDIVMKLPLSHLMELASK